jgi:hypothetical protein
LNLNDDHFQSTGSNGRFVVRWPKFDFQASEEPKTGQRRRITDMSRKDLEDLALRAQDEIVALKKEIRQHEEKEQSLSAIVKRLTSEEKKGRIKDSADARCGLFSKLTLSSCEAAGGHGATSGSSLTEVLQACGRQLVPEKKSL